MTARQIRRAQERKERKLARKAAAQQTTVQSASSDTPQPEPVRARVYTGPKTPEGKAISSQNSFKHGLYSEKLVLPNEDPAELDALRADLRAEHQPATTTEEILVNELAENFWRIRRMRRYEAHAMAGENFANWAPLLPIIARTMNSAERAFHKALTTLRQLQKERTGRSVPVVRVQQSKGEFVPQNNSVSTPDHQFVPQIHSDSALDNGFVSQNSSSESLELDSVPENLLAEAA